jgi:putative endonuclease
MTHKAPFVYILASQENGTLYIGVTSNLIQRAWQHKAGRVSSFVKKYEVFNLVYYEAHASMEAAIIREKQLKKWNRVWKIRLIERQNPEWKDLWGDILERY